MGYGEFVGGGSVAWMVKHNSGKAKGDKDANAADNGGIYVTLPDGTKHGPYNYSPTDKKTVLIEWS